MSLQMMKKLFCVLLFLLVISCAVCIGMLLERLSLQEQRLLIENDSIYFYNSHEKIDHRFAIFRNNDTGGYLITERRFDQTVAEFEINHVGLETRRLDSRVLDDSILPHATTFFTYSEDGSYVRGLYSVQNNDGTINRIYVDSEGAGQFDTMIVNENGNRATYKMAGMSWTKTETNETLEAHLMENSDIKQIDTSESLDNSPLKE